MKATLFAYLTRLLDLYESMFLYDVEQFSQPWMYWFVLPALGYFAFFMVKWTVLTMPIWLPFNIMRSGAYSMMPNIKFPKRRRRD